MKALAGLLRKEVYHILRDRRTLIVIVALPILQVVIFGYAIRTDVDHVRLAIVDPAPDPVTLAIRSRFGAARVFETVADGLRVQRRSEARVTVEGRESKAMADQIMTVSKARFTERMGILSPHDIRGVEIAIRIQLGLAV